MSINVLHIKYTIAAISPTNCLVHLLRERERTEEREIEEKPLENMRDS